MKFVIFLFLTLSWRALTHEVESSLPHFLSDAFIEKINTEQTSWKAGRNFDPKTPISELKALLGARMDQRNTSHSLFWGVNNHGDSQLSSDQHPNQVWHRKMKIPTHFDAREKWGKRCPTIGEVLDQGKCGSCWAISAAQAFSDRYCIASHGKHKKRLSTGEVMSCCFGCGYGCWGGWESRAWDFFHHHGLVTGGLYNTADGCQPYPIKSPCHYMNDTSPYQDCERVIRTPDCSASCTNHLYGKEALEDRKYAKPVYRVPEDEHIIQKEIMTHGPVTAAFMVLSDFYVYKSGVYDPLITAREMGGHAVKVIGWGVENDVPYWLVMNSWNDFWGEKGLIKMKRGSSLIRLENEMYAALPDYHPHK